MERLMKFFEQLFCRHEWYKTAVFEENDPIYNERYGIRRYVCRKCGKTVHQDSRRDRIGGIAGSP